MRSCGFLSLLACCLVFAAAPPARGQGKVGEEAPEFPPGVFTDAGSHSLNGLRGKVVVLYFFEPGWPKCRASIPEHNALVKAYQDKPVKFLAVMANATLAEASTYQAANGLAMPVYADSLGLMQKRYEFKISLENIHQVRVLDPDGKVAGYEMNKEALDKALDSTKPKWKYKGEKYDAKLGPVLDLLEDGQYAAAVKKLTPLRNSPSKEVAESGKRLHDALKGEAAKWKSEADAAAADEPIKAYDLYGRVAGVLAGTEAGSAAAARQSKLAANKSVSAELAARKAFAALKTTMSKLTPAQKQQAAKACEEIVKKYPKTPTAAEAAELLKDLK